MVRSETYFILLGMNIASVVLCLLVGEATVRLLSVQTPAGLVVGKTLFLNFVLGDVDD